MPTKAVREAIVAAEASGVRVVLATGRPFPSALRYARAFGLTNPVLCFQGSLVKEVGGEQRSLFAEGMPPAPLLDLFEYAAQRGLDLTLYSERRDLPGRHAPAHSFYDLWFGGEVEPVPSLEEGLRRIDDESLVPLKCLFIDKPDANDRLSPRLARQLRRATGHRALSRSFRRGRIPSPPRAAAWLSSPIIGASHVHK